MTINLDRRDEAIRLREAGLSYAEIGRRLDISRERVRQIVKGKRKATKAKLNSNGLLTPREVARLLGIHVSTVRRWGEKGVLRSYRITKRGDRRFLRQDVISLLEPGEESTNGQSS